MNEFEQHVSIRTNTNQVVMNTTRTNFETTSDRLGNELPADTDARHHVVGIRKR